MLKKTFFLITLLVLTLNFASVSCDITGTNCGPFNEFFETTAFETDLVEVTIQPNPEAIPEVYLTVDRINPQSVSFDQFSIRMTPVPEYYSALQKRTKKLLFINYALACSPPIIVSEEIITDIHITSNSPFTANLNVESNLAEYFDVVVVRLGFPVKRYSLIDFLNHEPTVPDQLFLMLNTKPESEGPLQFMVQYSQNGRSMNSFEFSTNPLLITD